MSKNLDIPKMMKEITFEITNRCDLRCRICSIWKENKKFDLSLEQIKKVVESFGGSFSVSLTGGEPFLNPHIDAIYKYFFKLFLQKKINNIDIATNAYSKMVLGFLENNKDYLKPLSLSISLDGIKKCHNLQRGKKDAFEKTLKNIMAIKKYGVPVMIKFVMSKINHKDAYNVYKLSKKLNCGFNLKFAEEVPNYYHRQDKCRSVILEAASLSAATEVLGKIYRDKNGRDKLAHFSMTNIKKFLSAGNLDFIKRCLTPQRSLFITSHGDIYNCIYQDRVGNIKSWPDLNKAMYNSIIANALKGKCPKCLSYHGYLREFNI